LPRDFKVRIAIGDASGARSHIWMIATARDDVYAFHRTMGGIEKISFHTSGICRRAFTEQYGAPEGMADRVILRWNRAQIAPAGSNTLTRLLSVSFPTSHLSTAAVPANKPVLWLAGAPPGRSRNLEAAVTQEPPATATSLIQQHLAHHQAVVLATHQTPNGNSLVLFSCEAEWARGNLIVPASKHEVDDLVFPEEETTGWARSIRLTMYKPPADGDCLMCAELSGFRMAPGEARRLFPNADRLTRDRVIDRRLPPNDS
jgi:hypothetical protein